MKKKLGYIITGLLCFILGVGLVILGIYFYPKEIVKTITEKNVSITDNGISESVMKVNDAVVVIEGYNNETLAGTGSGFVYDKDDKYAYIMTNHHVIDGFDVILITYSDDSTAEAEIVGSDSYADIAILKVNVDTILSVAEIGKSTDLKVGDTVFAVGSPMGKEFKNTVTKGILSGKDRLVSVDDYILNVMQTDAAINPGNSGGALCNINGEVIGVNNLKIVEDTVEGLGFSIPIEDALKYANSLREDGVVTRPYIGVSMLNAGNTLQLRYAGINLDRNITDGVVVVGVEDDSPADEAGLKRGDVITKIGEYKVNTIAEFRYRLYTYEVNEKVEIEIIRSGKEKTLDITLGSN